MKTPLNSDAPSSDDGGVTSPLPAASNLDFDFEAMAAEFFRMKSRQGAAGAVELIGRFEIKRALGSGGFGLVYLAQDTTLGRLVALKVPRPDVAWTTDFLKRFDREGRAAAALDHPNIVPVFEVSNSGETPYIASAYCPGPTLAEWLRRSPLPTPREAASLVAQLARAISHAHERLVLHRDVKPGNVLLPSIVSIGSGGSTWQSGAMDPVANEPQIGALSDTIPKLTDFGLARLLDEEGNETKSIAVLGTVAYMSPEQAQGQSHQVGPQTDIYSLGATLYELLTGRPPFQGTQAELLQQVMLGEPIRPRRLRATIPADLEAVCLKCLEKDGQRRYSSAAALSDDLERFLNDRPTKARPQRMIGQFVRVVRRHPLVTVLSALAVFAVLAAVALGFWAVIGRTEASAARRLAQERQFLQLLGQVTQRRLLPYEEGWTRNSISDLSEAIALPAAADHLPKLRSEAIAALTSVDLQRRASFTEFPVYVAAFSPDGKIMAAGSWTTVSFLLRIRLIGADDLNVIRELTLPPNLAEQLKTRKDDGIRHLAFSDDGRWLAAATRFRQVFVWDLQSQAGAPMHIADDQDAPRFQPGSPMLYTRAADSILGWDMANGGQQTSKWESTSHVAFTANGREWAYFLRNKLNLCRSVKKPFRVTDSARRGEPMFAPDGRTLVVRNGNQIWLQDSAQSNELLSLVGPDGQQADDLDITDQCFIPKTTLMASASEWSRHVRLWDIVAGRLVADVVAGPDGSMRLSAAPNRLRFVVAAEKRADIIDVAGPEFMSTVAFQPTRIKAAAFIDAGNSSKIATLAEGAGNSWSSIWDARNQAPSLDAVDAHIMDSASIPGIAATGDGRFIAFKVDGGTQCWQPHTKEKLNRVAIPGVKQLAIGPDNHLWIVTERAILKYSLPDLKQIVELDSSTLIKAESLLYSIAVGANSVIVGRRNGQAIHCSTTGELRVRWEVGNSPIVKIALDRAEQRVALADERGRVKVVRLSDNAPVFEVPDAHRDGIYALGFAPNGWLATGSRDRTVKIWNTEGSPIATLYLNGPVAMVQFSKDGRELFALVDGERGLRRWMWEDIMKRLNELGLGVP